MTGEITLRGKVSPVGGIKDKILAAYRAESARSSCPRRTTRDLDDFQAEEIRGAMEFHLVNTMDEGIKVAMEGLPPSPPRRSTWRRSPRRGDPSRTECRIPAFLK